MMRPSSGFRAPDCGIWRTSPGKYPDHQSETDSTIAPVRRSGGRRNLHRRTCPQYAQGREGPQVTGTGGKDKTMVLILKRRGEVRTKVVSSRRKKALQSEVRQHVEAGSAIFTDALKSYEGLSEFEHQVVDHAVEYVRGNVHTNGLENSWSLLSPGCALRRPNQVYPRGTSHQNAEWSTCRSLSSFSRSFSSSRVAAGHAWFIGGQIAFSPEFLRVTFFARLYFP